MIPPLSPSNCCEKSPPWERSDRDSCWDPALPSRVAHNFPSSRAPFLCYYLVTSLLSISDLAFPPGERVYQRCPQTRDLSLSSHLSARCADRVERMAILDMETCRPPAPCSCGAKGSQAKQRRIMQTEDLCHHVLRRRRGRGWRGVEKDRGVRVHVCVYKGIVMVTSLTKQMAALNDGHPNSSPKAGAHQPAASGAGALPCEAEALSAASRSRLSQTDTCCRSLLGKATPGAGQGGPQPRASVPRG